MTKKTFIISLGGSLIVPPKGIDYKFLKNFRKIILKYIKNNYTFFIISGGGMTCRNYIQSAKKIIKVTDNDCDWLGIHATRLNAHLLRTIFRKESYHEIIKNPTIHFPIDKK